VTVASEAVKTEMNVVPLTAVTRSKANPNGYAVFVVEEREGKSYARLRNVEVGQSFGNAIAIVSGIQKGELVITTGATQVADGDLVKLIP
jgi:multidrug efflux pump subunit AcrA (membrane-fusion protein)